MAAIAWATGLALTTVLFVHLPLGIAEPSFKLKWLPLLVIALYFIVQRWTMLMTLAPHINVGMPLMYAWAMLSVLWAPSTGYAFTQLVSVIGATLLGLAFVLSGWRPDRFENVLTATVTGILIASLLVALTIPRLGVGSDGIWHGITYQKNGLGQVAATGLLLWNYRLWAGRSRRATSLAGMALSLVMLLQSGSNTALMLSLIGCACSVAILRPGFSIGWIGRRMVFLGMVVLVPLVGYLVVMTSTFEAIGLFFGKGVSFTGRTFIWQELLEQIAKHPIQGIGFGSFWVDGNWDVAQIQTRLRWEVTAGHNGYLDVTNEMGIVGLAGLLLFLALHALALGRLAKVNRTVFALQLSLFLFVIMTNFSESGWFRPIQFTHLLGMFCSFEVSRHLLAHRFAVARARAAAHDAALSALGDAALARPGQAGGPSRRDGSAPRYR